MNIVLVHDWLMQMGGAEKVLEALCELYDCPIYTLFKDPNRLKDSPFAQRSIHASFLDKIPRMPSLYRYFLPLFPKAISTFDLSSYDIILSSSHAVAKGVKTSPHQIHICYCHTPFRSAWDPTLFHIKQVHPLLRPLANKLFASLRSWDQSQFRVDYFIANSTYVQKKIQILHGQDAVVIHPPVDTHLFKISSNPKNYYITCSRLVPYKRIDLLLQAFAKFPEKKLLIVGEGPDARKLKAKAPKNVVLLGYKPRDVYCKLISEAKAFVFAAEEDFGIALVEAQAAGVPVIAFGKGGSLDTVLPGKTGIFFKEQTSPAIADALFRFEKMEGDFEPEKIKEHAEKFNKERFQREMQAFILEKVALRK